ncbi:MAG: transcriptional repressor [Magnetococcales bacterium]|nr:transcriptional repressor [Magnetococcales bacterium]NGZ26374.1 transcriptional repressor [Magnetococcales bacterium]
MPMSKMSVADKLRNAGISPTSQRVEIAHFFLNRRDHLSADQILEGVNREYPAVSRGTVYNALNLLVEKGLVVEVIAAPGKVFYDPNPKPHHHIYFVDRGTLEDLPESLPFPSQIQLPMEKLKDIPLGPNAWVERVDLVVRVRG